MTPSPPSPPCLSATSIRRAFGEHWRAAILPSEPAGEQTEYLSMLFGSDRVSGTLQAALASRASLTSRSERSILCLTSGVDQPAHTVQSRQHDGASGLWSRPGSADRPGPPGALPFAFGRRLLILPCCLTAPLSLDVLTALPGVQWHPAHQGQWKGCPRRSERAAKRATFSLPPGNPTGPPIRRSQLAVPLVALAPAAVSRAVLLAVLPAVFLVGSLLLATALVLALALVGSAGALVALALMAGNGQTAAANFATLSSGKALRSS